MTNIETLRFHNFLLVIAFIDSLYNLKKLHSFTKPTTEMMILHTHALQLARFAAT